MIPPLGAIRTTIVATRADISSVGWLFSYSSDEASRAEKVS